MNYDPLLRNRTAYSDYASLMSSLVFTLILSVLLSGCSLFDTNNSEPETEDVPFEILRQFPIEPSAAGVPSPVVKCSFNHSNIDSTDQEVPPNGLSGLELIITDQEDLELYLTCDVDAVEISLDTDFIIAGTTNLQPHGVFVNEQHLMLENNTLRYYVEIGALDTTQPGTAGYIISVPNVYRDYPVDFKVDWREEQ